MYNLRQLRILCSGYPLLVLLFLFHGCSAPKLPVYPVSQANNAHIFNNEDLTIFVTPLFDSKEIQTYFGTDLARENILPVFINVKNKGSKDSYVVFHDKIFLRDSADSAAQMDAGEKQTEIDTTGSIALISVGSVLICPPLLAAGVLADASRHSNAAEIKRNFKAKALQTQTLSQGETCNGFVYFRLSEKNNNMNAPFIAVETKNLQTRKTQAFQIPIAWKGETK